MSFAVAVATGLVLTSAAVATSPDTTGSNRLADETSPYLLLHAHNPVDWYPWGPEALERARAEARPIFLSIGYSTCYWCHVMEREVFCDPEIAALMNQWFINIKVDREERPDLDRIYMAATQLLSGRGGWPNSVFLTPDLQPFFAGTYFPPTDQSGRPGFPRVLEAMHHAWTERRDDVEDVAGRLTASIRQAESQATPPRDLEAGMLAAVVEQLEARYDGTYGGFGGAPKFPPAIRLELLLQVAVDGGGGAARRIVDHTLQAMARGGIHDHVGGGFHRYATDAQWRVPHFEKMLYNQAQMLRLYARAFRVTGDERWRRVALGILAFVRREMTSPQGAYYSAVDAESEHVEGKYYTWSEAQVRAALGDASADTLLAVYGLEPVPEGEGGALFQRRALAAAAADLDTSIPALRQALEAVLEGLRVARRERTYPLLDDKTITAWNGMMIAAAAEAGVAVGNREAVSEAARAARFALAHLRAADGGLLRIYRGGAARLPGYLEDYAHLAEGLLALHRATGDREWLDEAVVITDAMLARFWDEAGDGFHFSTAGADLIARSKVAQDGALPAANAVAVHVLLAVARETGEGRYRDYAARGLRVFAGNLASAPAAHAHLASAVRVYLGGSRAAESSGGGDAASRFGVTGASGVAAPAADSLVRVDLRLDSQPLAPGGEVDLTVAMRIAPGWHVTAHPAAAGLVPTSVTVNSGQLPLRVTGITYPRGQGLYFAALAETLSVYEGDTEVTVRLVRASAGSSSTTGDLRVLVEYQACDATRCLQPAEAVLRLPVRLTD